MCDASDPEQAAAPFAAPGTDDTPPASYSDWWDEGSAGAGAQEVADLLIRARRAAQDASATVSDTYTPEADAATLGGALLRVDSLAEEIGGTLDAALVKLEGMGAVLDLERPVSSLADHTVPLASLDTAAMRALLSALDTAAAVAVLVDHERGHLDSDGRANGYAASLGVVAAQLRRDTYGPAGTEGE